jgi:hypothetical protein
MTELLVVLLAILVGRLGGYIEGREAGARPYRSPPEVIARVPADFHVPPQPWQ